MAAFEVIDHVQFGSDTAYYEKTSIPDTYQHLYILGSSRSTRTSYTDGSGIRLNGHSSNGDYHMTTILIWGPSSPGAYDTVGDTQSSIGYLMDSPGASQEANVFSTSHCWILDYTATDKFTGMIGGASVAGYSGDTNDYQHTFNHGHCTQTKTEKIHTVRITNGVGNFAAGSAWTLYGVNSA
jgi:hypothetical protein